MPTKGPHPVDIHVGSRLKLRRTLLGKTQGELGKAVGLTFQQIQKYERGSNRMGSSRLYQFAEFLDVPISFFFDDMPGGVETRVVDGYIKSEKPDDVIARDETTELVRMYYSAKPRRLRKQLYELVKALARSASDETREND